MGDLIAKTFLTVVFSLAACLSLYGMMAMLTVYKIKTKALAHGMIILLSVAFITFVWSI